MKNPNSPLRRAKNRLTERWQGEDYPGAQPRFQIHLFGKDFTIFVVMPILAIILFKSCEKAFSRDQRPTRPERTASQNTSTEVRSQIIEFVKPTQSAQYAGVSNRAPGTLVKVKLLNVIETYGNAPVHAQVIDTGLGQNLVGATLIGDATSDSNINRINMEFRFVRSARTAGFAIPINARALSLDGTLGLTAKKKEGFFAGAALNSTGSFGQEGQGQSEAQGLNQIIAKALTSGLLQEFGSESQVARNRAQVLSLQPLTEFYVELTDFFPGSK